MKNFTHEVEEKIKEVPNAPLILAMFKEIEHGTSGFSEAYGLNGQPKLELEVRVLGLVYDFCVYRDTLALHAFEIDEVMSAVSMPKVSTAAHAYVALEEMGQLNSYLLNGKSNEQEVLVEKLMEDVGVFHEVDQYFDMIDHYRNYVDAILQFTYTEEQLKTASEFISEWFGHCITRANQEDSQDEHFQEMISNNPHVQQMLKNMTENLPEGVTMSAGIGTFDEKGNLTEIPLDMPIGGHKVQ